MNPLWLIIGSLVLAVVAGLAAGLSGRKHRRGPDWAREAEMTALWAIVLSDDE